MFLHAKIDNLVGKVTPIDLSTGKRMRHVICADTETGFFMKHKTIDGKFVVDEKRQEIVRETGIVPCGILFTQSRVNMQGRDLLN